MAAAAKAAPPGRAPRRPAARTDSSSGGTDGPAPGQDGGDATTQGEGGTGDAGVEAAPPLQQLTCNTWDNASPTLVMKLFPSDGGGGGGTPFNQFMVEHVPGVNAARLVVAYGQTGSSTSVVTASENGGGISALTLSGTGLEYEQKTPTGVAFLVQNYMANQYEYYSIADNDPGTAPAGLVGPAPAVPAPPNLLTSGNGGNFQMQGVPLPTGGYYTLASYPTTSTTFDTASLLAAASAWSVLEGPGSFQQLGPFVLDGTNVYGFMPPAGMGDNGPSAIDMFTFSTAGSAPTLRSIVAAGSTAATAAAAAVTGGYALAFAEIGSAQQAAFRVGVVPQAKINTFMIDDLGSLSFNVQSDAGFFDTTPFNGRNGKFARWLSNGDLGVMGSGGTGGTSGNYTGLNFYVATPGAQWLVETAGSGKNVLPGKTVLGSAFDLAQAVSEILLKFDVAWIEQDATGAYSLYFNVLDCQL